MTGILTSRRMALLEVAAVGLPFCGFKMLAGASVAATSSSGGVRAAGLALATLGVVDLLVNLANAGSLCLTGRRPGGACALSLLSAWMGRESKHPQWAWQDFGNALDVMLSFSLVAFMIWGGRLGLLSPARMALWSACVIVNVLGSGLGRISSSVKNFS